MPQLVSEARRKAQSMASAANLTLGPLQSLYDSNFAARYYVFLSGLSGFGFVVPGARIGIALIGRAPPRGDLQTTFTVTARFSAR